MRRETFATPGPVRLVVRVPAGAVDVETAETGETVVELEPLNERAEQVVEDASVTLRGDEIRIELDQKRLLILGRTPSVRVAVRAPLGSSVEADTAAADVAGHGRFGSVDVKTASGDVRFDAVERDTAITAVSGDVAVGTVGGETAVKTVSGDVKVDEAARDASVQTVSGDLVLGAVTQGKVNLKTVSGDIRVGIRPGSSLWVDANSVSGKTMSELELGDAPPDSDKPLVELRAKSVSGDIRVVRASSVSV
jgi:hypothetical protein